jgi:hypothetical protein
MLTHKSLIFNYIAPVQILDNPVETPAGMRSDATRGDSSTILSTDFVDKESGTRQIRAIP